MVRWNYNISALIYTGPVFESIVRQYHGSWSASYSGNGVKSSMLWQPSVPAAMSHDVVEKCTCTTSTETFYLGKERRLTLPSQRLVTESTVFDRERCSLSSET